MVVLMKIKEALLKAWAWIKANWKWILFPVGLVVVILAAISTILAKIFGGTDPDVVTIDELNDKKDEEIEEANAIRDAKLQELAETHKKRLEELSDEQEQELQELAEKPIEEVVAWFDQF